MLPTHLTAIRYKVAPDGPWKSGIVVGTHEQIAENLERQCVSFKLYENGDTHFERMAAVRLPDGRVFDIEQGRYVEEEEAHA